MHETTDLGHPPKEDPDLSSWTRFLAACRTSTDDQQSPEDSKRWQVGRCTQLVSGHGEIVEVIHDAGYSRSVPWARRPEALVLMERIKQPAHIRGFDAVVVAEPQRAWGDAAQIIDVLRKFEHYNVPVWVPEIGGPVNLSNEAHAIQLGVYGVMSESERRRISIRVRAALAEHVRTGSRYWVAARAPYGYRLVKTDQLHPNPAKAREGICLKRLEVDPPAAEIVREIFERYADGTGRRAIAVWLNSTGTPTPMHYRPYRVPRAKLSGEWGTTTIGTILNNPVYIGYLVWGREGGRDRLVDVENTTLGYQRVYTANPKSDWIWSPEPTHDAIVTPELWTAVQTRRKENSETWQGKLAQRAPHDSPHPYVLRGIAVCEQCGAFMVGAHQRGYTYVRCLLSPYAATLPQCDGHPKTAYLREDRVVPGLLDLVTRLLTDPDSAAETARMMAAAAANPTGEDGRTAAANRRVADAQARIQQFRRALEAGGDPVLIGQWINEAVADLQAAETAMAQLGTRRRPLTQDEIRSMVERITPTFQEQLEQAADGPAKLNRFLRTYGVRVQWRPRSDTATVTIAPPLWRIGKGATCDKPHPGPSSSYQMNNTGRRVAARRSRPVR